jgi:hypothetical protein
VHPARPAVDECPVCGRPRCGADAASVPRGCLACRGEAAAPDEGGRRAGSVERGIRGALVAVALGLLGGWIATEYIGAGAFAYIVPFLVGLCCASAACAAAGTTGHGRFDLTVRLIGAASALVGIVLSYRLVPGGQSPWSPPSEVLPAYGAVLVGAFVSRVLR